MVEWYPRIRGLGRKSYFFENGKIVTCEYHGEVFHLISSIK